MVCARERADTIYDYRGLRPARPGPALDSRQNDLFLTFVGQGGNLRFNTPIASDYLQESRTGRNIRHHLVPLLRQSIYSRLAGYDDTNDAERLSQDPAMRVVVGWQGSDRNAARTNTMSRFETETLTQEDNLKGLALMNPQWVELAMAHTPHRRVILDMDSSESPVHGQQEGAAYNGHFECVCYHPLCRWLAGTP